jgi:uncharacterized Tic20 family protein
MTTPPPAAAPQPVSPSDEKTWSILSHVGGIILGFLGPLIVFLIYKDRSAVIRQHAVAALNFQLTLLIGWIIGYILLIVLIGGLILAAVGVVSLIFGIIAAIAANEGRPYKYPFAIAFVK